MAGWFQRLFRRPIKVPATTRRPAGNDPVYRPSPPIFAPPRKDWDKVQKNVQSDQV